MPNEKSIYIGVVKRLPFTDERKNYRSLRKSEEEEEEMKIGPMETEVWRKTWAYCQLSVVLGVRVKTGLSSLIGLRLRTA